MVKIHVAYEGHLRCKLTHAPSGTVIRTDAPKDNEGRGEAFSPTDLVAAALGSCILTTMAIYAKRKGWELGGCEAEVIKEMVAEPARSIGKLAVSIKMPKGLSPDKRQLLERAATACPVHKSLSHDVQIPVTFQYTDKNA